MKTIDKIKQIGKKVVPYALAGLVALGGCGKTSEQINYAAIDAALRGNGQVQAYVHRDGSRTYVSKKNDYCFCEPNTERKQTYIAIDSDNNRFPEKVITLLDGCGKCKNKGFIEYNSNNPIPAWLEEKDLELWQAFSLMNPDSVKTF